ncbi:MAG: Ig-like domain-containing protein, partial [Bacteroidota bacterium]
MIKQSAAVLLGVIFCNAPLLAIHFETRTTPVFEWQQWELLDDSWSGNPFDVVAHVTFTKQSTGETRSTEMFYVGDNRWRFRFTGSSIGSWSFTTSADDPDLNGHTGVVEVLPNPDSSAQGFLTSSGNKYAIEVGNDGRLKGFLLNIFQNDREHTPYKHTHITDFEGAPASKMSQYLDYAKAQGFTAVYVMLNHNLLQWGAYGHNEHSSESPDLQAFHLLDTLITTAHDQGMYIYFWRWGDEFRKWTPAGLSGGINGAVDKRITRYMAARMGPLPGWAMGYGFDLHEWANDHVDEWQQYFHDKLGWPHLLSARSRVFQDAISVIQGYAQGSKVVTSPNKGLKTRENPSYAELVRMSSEYLDRPHLLEERNVQGRWGVSDDDTRLLLWKTAMAGGIGGWYGHFSDDVVFGGDRGYANSSQLLCHRLFWEHRFLLDLEVENHLSSDDPWVLQSASSDHLIAFQTQVSEVSLDLSGWRGPAEVVAVDTKLAYAEVALGEITPGTHLINLPYSSDWAIAVGDFSSGAVEQNRQPMANLVANLTAGPAPLTVTFDATNSQDADGDSLSFHWDFGDGDVADLSLVDHTFQTSGDHTVVLTVNDGHGGFAIDSLMITVFDAPIPVTGVLLDQDTVTLTAHETVSLVFEVQPDSASDPSVIWTSADPQVAEVDANGLLSGLSQGITTITVNTVDGGFSDQLTVSVQAAPEGALDNVTYDDQPATQYGVHEIALAGDGSVARPMDTDLTVTFTTPSGIQYEVNGFYDESDDWKARVYLRETGTWTWRSASADDANLDGATGSFQVWPSSLRGKLQQHEFRPNAWQTEDGQWFLNIADTPYFLFHPNEDKWQEYVEEIADLGITMMRSSVLGALNPNVQDPGGWEMIFTDDSYNELDIEHFQRTDLRIKWLLNHFPDMYIQLILVPRSNTGYNKDESFWKKLSTTQKDRYLKEVLARYGAFPQVFFQIANDYNCTTRNNVAMFDYIGNYLESQDPWSSLTSTGCVRGAQFPFVDRAWSDYVHIETLDALAADQVRDYPSNMHVFAGEDRYETHRPMDHPAVFMRRIMWSWLLSEGSACYGGQWRSIEPYSTTTLTGLDDIRYIKDFIVGHSIDLSRFDDRDDAVDAQAGAAERPQVAYAPLDNRWLVYHPNATRSDQSANVSSETASFRFDDWSAATYDYVWMKADDGQTVSGSLNHPGGGVVWTSPWPGIDVVLYAWDAGDYQPIVVSGVSMDQEDTLSLFVQQQVQLSATVVPLEASTRSVIWSSEDPQVATVNALGQVTAVSQGTTAVIVTTVDGGFQDSVAIEVTEAEGLTWIEDFSGWPNGTTVDNGPTAWEAHQDGRSKSGGLFGVQDEALLVNATNTKDSKFVTWASEVIDISGYGTVNVSLDLQSEGVMEDRGQW